MFLPKKILILFTLIFSLIFSSCGSASTPTAKPIAATEKPVKGPVTLTYLSSQDWVKDSEIKLSKKFEEETGIHIEYKILPSDEYFKTLKNKLDSGEGPDIFGGQSGKTDIKLQLDVKRNAVPLTDEEWVKRMDPLSVEQVSIDGVVYGQTIWDTSGGSWVIVYNKDIFAKNGLTVPTNYADFAYVCKTLLKAEVTPIYEPMKDGWHHVLWFPEIGPKYEAANPGLIEALNTNKTKFVDDPTMLLAMTQLKEMYDLGYFGSDALSNEFVGTESAMASGKYAMTVNRLGLPDQIEKAFPDSPADRFDFFLIPLADNQIWNVNPAGPSKFIYSGSKNIDAAKAYFEFLARQENLQYMLDNESQFVLLNFKGVKYELSPAQTNFVNKHTNPGTVLQTAVNYVNPQWMDIGKDMVSMFTGTMKPADTLEAIDQRRTDLAKIAGDSAWK